MTLQEVIQTLNQADLCVFAQKANPGKFSVSVKSPKGGRIFVDRVATQEIMANGKTKWVWSLGREMQASPAPSDLASMPLAA